MGVPAGFSGVFRSDGVTEPIRTALAGQEEHLIFKGVRVEAIRVVKDNGLPFPPIFKIEFCAVFRGDGAHRIPLVVVVV
jgi:hypothetical protein